MKKTGQKWEANIGAEKESLCGTSHGHDQNFSFYTRSGPYKHESLCVTIPVLLGPQFSKESMSKVEEQAEGCQVYQKKAGDGLHQPGRGRNGNMVRAERMIFKCSPNRIF